MRNFIKDYGIIIGVGVILCLSVVGAYLYLDLLNQLNESNIQSELRQSELEKDLEVAQSAADYAQAQADIAKKESRELNSQIEEVQEEAQSEINSLRNQLRTADLAVSTSALVGEWNPTAGYVYCQGDGFTSEGSATAVAADGESVYVLTNYHVVSDAEYCGVAFPGDTEEYYLAEYENLFWDDSPYDWAIIEVVEPSLGLSLRADAVPFCSMDEANIGDRVMILGYPTSGASSSVTVTRGIISGFSDEYIVTDAKIDHGNSGGTAVNTDYNCFLGIPTMATVGSIESYGHILDINYIY